jgi:hypothetical protein
MFDVSIPRSTPIATPAVIALPFDDGQVDRIEMRWPPGPSGLVGIKVRHSGQTVIPFSDNTWLKTNDEVVIWPLENYPEANAWTVLGYNLDIYDHAIQFRLLVNDAPAPRPTVQLVAI